MMVVQSILCDIPPSLRVADQLLTEYGRWATTWGARGGSEPTLERRFRRHLDRHESLAAFDARRVPANPLMPVIEAMLCQRALSGVADRERIVLSIIYVRSRYPIHQMLRLMRIPASLCRIRHQAGLRMFDNLHRMLAAELRTPRRDEMRERTACIGEKLVATIAATS
jgi:hypothetical protein